MSGLDGIARQIFLMSFLFSGYPTIYRNGNWIKIPSSKKICIFFNECSFRNAITPESGWRIFVVFIDSLHYRQWKKLNNALFGSQIESFCLSDSLRSLSIEIPNRGSYQCCRLIKIIYYMDNSLFSTHKCTSHHNKIPTLIFSFINTIPS